MSIESLVNIIKKYNPGEEEKIIKAYNYACKKHFGQKRKSGEDYIIHPLHVAITLASLHADADTVCAGLLHDTIEDTNTTYNDLVESFNSNIADLVNGVTNIQNDKNGDFINLRRIIMSLKNDARIMIIKLADRLHNMQTLKYMPIERQKSIARETLDIYVPIAYFIGAYGLKKELEDLSFFYLNPEKHQEIKNQRNIIEKENRMVLESMANLIGDVLRYNNIYNNIQIRIKGVYELYSKLEEGHNLGNIHDLLALKIFVDYVEDCYRSLGLVHKLYRPMNSKFKDYICCPKKNLYESLHTTVFGPNDTLVQTQIRTKEMQNIAENGLATYWDENKGKAGKMMVQDLNNKFPFMQVLLNLDNIAKDDKDFVEKVKQELFVPKIYIRNTSGDVIELPKGSTPIDYAYKKGEEYGNHLVSVIVNDEFAPFNYSLKSNDRIHIITSDKEFTPKDNWEEYARTVEAKELIRKLKQKK